MRRKLFDLLRLVANSRWGRFIIRILVVHMNFILPLERLIETRTLIAFHHPRPAYPLHIVLMPKEAIQNLMVLPLDNTVFMQDMFASVQQLIVQFDLETSGYRLICNGGPNQDIPQLHFHLISEVSIDERA
jgi:histidine triad (HIT) family protein